MQVLRITAPGATIPRPAVLLMRSHHAREWINALALVARHPDQVRILVAHEPPTAQVLPDREPAFAATEDIQRTYQRSGAGPAMAKFIALVSYKGPIPADYVDQPAPDPGMFGLPTTDDGSRNDPLVGQNIITCTHYEPDFEALRAASTRIVLAAGAESEGELAHRGAEAVAERLGTSPVTFPSNHGGFLGGEYGARGDRCHRAGNHVPRAVRGFGRHRSGA